MHWLDDMFSLMRYVERVTEEQEQLRRAVSPALQRAAEMHRALSISLMAKAMQQYKSTAKIIESAQQLASMDKAAELLPSLAGEQLHSLGGLEWPEPRGPDLNPLSSIKEVFIAHSAEETNEHLAAGWIIIGAPSIDNATGEGVWMLGRPHREDPKEPENNA